MISVIIPTHNNEKQLVRALAALVSGSAEGLVREVVIVDGGAQDTTQEIADVAGATYVPHTGSMGALLAEGATHAKRGEWLLFLKPYAILEPSWTADVRVFVERLQRTARTHSMAGTFTYHNEDFGWKARLKEKTSNLKSEYLGKPDPVQGLFLSKTFYEKLGGHKRAVSSTMFDLNKPIRANQMQRLRSIATDFSKVA